MLQIIDGFIPIGTGPISEDRVVWQSFDEYEAQRSSIPWGDGYSYTIEERMRITGMNQRQVMDYFCRAAKMEAEALRQANAITSNDVDECVPMDIDEDIDPDL